MPIGTFADENERPRDDTINEIAGKAPRISAPQTWDGRHGTPPSNAMRSAGEAGARHQADDAAVADANWVLPMQTVVGVKRWSNASRRPISTLSDWDRCWAGGP